MSPVTLEQAFDLFTGVDVPGPATRYIEEKQEQLLAAVAEELAGLRFSIVLTARWEGDRDEDPKRRKELRAELDSLRTRYFDKIDRIAMSIGVDIAMKIKDEVEQRVTLPLRAGFADMIGGSAND
ncbi:MAG: hypothetical protein WBA18_07520 [Terracidiphilus sp.]